MTLTDDDLAAMAEAAELCSWQTWYGDVILAAQWQEDINLMPFLRRFADAVQAKERGRCANVLREMWGEREASHGNRAGPYHDGWTAALDLAERRLVLGPSTPPHP